jgi:hypothetical protein
VIVGSRPVGPRSRVHAKARSREVPMRIGQIFARALGPHQWSRSQVRPSRAAVVIHQAGQDAGQTSEIGGAVGPESQEELAF